MPANHTQYNHNVMVDLLQTTDFLSAAECAGIVAELCVSGGGAATVHGKETGHDKATGTVEPLVRKATRVVVSPELRGRVTRQLLERKGAIAEHFGIALSDCEEPQFLRYKPGDYFVAHQDGNTPLIFDQSRLRRISVVIFLSPHSMEPAPGTYGGGALVFHVPSSNPALRLPLAPAAGTLIAFRAETTHEVTPVTHGERYTIVSWYR